MAKNFRELELRMDPDARNRAQTRARELIGEMLLSELRKSAGMTQEELAAVLGVKQPNLSRLESQDDMQVSTLRRLVEALGGQLEIVARLPEGDVRLSQFRDAG